MHREWRSSGQQQTSDTTIPPLFLLFSVIGRLLERPPVSPPQPRHSTRQIRTTVPGVGWGYLDVASDEMSQTFSVLSPLPLTIRFPSGLKLTL